MDTFVRRYTLIRITDIYRLDKLQDIMRFSPYVIISADLSGRAV
jgi:hypothetical protein